MKKIKWAILGPGAIAADFAKAIIEVNGSIYAVGARSLEKSKEFARNYNIEKAYGTYEEMLKDDEINVVYISTPSIILNILSRTRYFAVFHISKTRFYAIGKIVEPEKDKKRDNLSTLNTSA